MTPKQRHREGVLTRDPECALRRLKGCRGKLQAHHVIPVVRLKAAHQYTNGRRKDARHPLHGTNLDDLIADPRNGVTLCEVHHSICGELRHLDLPVDVYSFAEQYGLEWSITRDFGELAA